MAAETQKRFVQWIWIFYIRKWFLFQLVGSIELGFTRFYNFVNGLQTNIKILSNKINNIAVIKEFVYGIDYKSYFIQLNGSPTLLLFVSTRKLYFIPLPQPPSHWSYSDLERKKFTWTQKHE